MDFTVGNGYLPDPKDDRDVDFSELLPKISVSSGDIDLIEIAGNRMTELSSQSWSSSCVANASLDSLELLDAVNGGTPIDLSRLHLYWHGRCIALSAIGEDEEKIADNGMYLRAAVKALAKLGVCPEALWPFDLRNINKRPPLKATFRGLKNKIDGYYSITANGSARLEQCHQALKSKHPFIFAIPVTEAFRSCKSDVPIPAPKKSDKIFGYHAIIGCGTHDLNTKIRNSWGRRYGFDGHAFLSPEWFEEGHANSIWVFTKSKALVA